MVLQICKYANNMNSRLADFYETFANIASLYMVSVLSCSSLSVSDLDMHIQVCTSKSRRNVIMQNPDLCGITQEVRDFIRDNCAMDTPEGEARKGKRLDPRSIEFKRHPNAALFENWMTAARIQYQSYIESTPKRQFKEASFKQFLRPIKFCKDKVVLKLIELYNKLREKERIYEHYAHKKWHVSRNFTHFIDSKYQESITS